ncbi:MAG: amidase family protein [Paracoccaceae bacterium]|nr:amidase family protein [Paracoccaceae bacterium]
MNTNSNELISMTATEAVARLRSKDVSPLELVDASIQRIEAVDTEVNALPIHCFEQAREQAKFLDIKAHAANPKSVCGLPIAVKDYNDLGGAVTTYGSPIFADDLAQKSDATVRQLECNGAIAVAKSNVPEWAGGHTFNPVNGLTRNPWDLRKSAGGSSGGSAAALACGSVWLATGNDLGGSLRTPAAFNGIVGLRPGPGRIPRGTRLPSMDTLWVEGPMARNVSDLALMLDAGVGQQIDDPLSFDHSGPSFVEALQETGMPKRVAFSPDLSIVSMEKEIANVCGCAATVFADLGADVTDDIPDFTGVLEAFQTLRAVLFATMMEPVLAQHRDQIAPEIIGNIERGLNIRPSQIFEAERVRIELYKKVIAFFETHDFLICPAASIAPFPVEQRYVTEIDGKPCETYIDWFSITFALTMTACPTISVPCGFTAEGLPVGVQIMGKPRGEAALLRAAKRFEQVVGISTQLPITPRSVG